MGRFQAAATSASALQVPSGPTKASVPRSRILVMSLMGRGEATPAEEPISAAMKPRVRPGRRLGSELTAFTASGRAPKNTCDQRNILLKNKYYASTIRPRLHGKAGKMVWETHSHLRSGNFGIPVGLSEMTLTR